MLSAFLFFWFDVEQNVSIYLYHYFLFGLHESSIFINCCIWKFSSDAFSLIWYNSVVPLQKSEEGLSFLGPLRFTHLKLCLTIDLRKLLLQNRWREKISTFLCLFYEFKQKRLDTPIQFAASTAAHISKIYFK